MAFGQHFLYLYKQRGSFIQTDGAEDTIDSNMLLSW